MTPTPTPMPTLKHRPPSRLSQLSDADADLDLEKKDEQLHLEDAVPGARETSQYSAADEAFLATFDDKRRARMYRKIDVRLLPMLALLYLFACE